MKIGNYEFKEVVINFSNTSSDADFDIRRNVVRMRVVEEFAKEPAGKGKHELSTRRIYKVENLNDGRFLYLQRPANLHNGFDFLICADGVQTDKKKPFDKAPAHTDMVQDLQSKKEASPKEYQKLKTLMQKIFECYDVSDEEISDVYFDTGYSVKLTLSIIKWMFIEQDIRYWNYSGRSMLWNGEDGIAGLSSI
jgi:hypothetical protein